MQKLISKYGLAAHLALMAVAPLFISPTAVLWLSVLTAIWVIMEPSRIGEEMLHDSRERVAKAIVCDPLFWSMMVITIVGFIRFINDGVALAYDMELESWAISMPKFNLLPGSVSGSGYAEFAAIVAMLVVVQGVGHALGKLARLAFAVSISAIGGMVALTMLLMPIFGFGEVKTLGVCTFLTPKFIGSAFGMLSAMSIIALLTVFEQQWHRVLLLVLIASVGNVAGLFAFAPPMVIVGFLAMILLVFIYAFIYAKIRLPGTSEFKLLVLWGLSLVGAWVIVDALLDPMVMAEKIAPFMTGDFITEEFLQLRNALSNLSMTIWKEHPWIGTGLGSFPLDLNFNATPDDWDVIPVAQGAPLNGYWLLLLERGTIGAFLMIVPAALIVWVFVRRLIGGIKAEQMPHPLCFVGVFVSIVVLAEAMIDSTLLMPGMLTLLAALNMVAANTFVKEKQSYG